MNNTPIPKQEKNILRDKYLTKRLAVTSEMRADFDPKITAELLSLATYRYADTVLLYAASKGEVDTTEIFHEAVKVGKAVYYPRCCPENEGKMYFHRVTCLSQLVPGRFGLCEPQVHLPTLSRDTLNAFCIVPALSFDNEGFRLGYGKGYYDRFLANFEGTSAGIVYSVQKADNLPRGFYDIPVHIVVTEVGAEIIK
ncbi:MAG: 5-formyltetrahydrofolate cyclo-ligase [Oscillospiraceae bacterium]|nr:5-formyltetrahydrofolate cyclo-ligase [Oscillospiraceae bacterium]